jgi:hypothetical protein
MYEMTMDQHWIEFSPTVPGTGLRCTVLENGNPVVLEHYSYQVAVWDLADRRAISTISVKLQEQAGASSRLSRKTERRKAGNTP